MKGDWWSFITFVLFKLTAVETYACGKRPLYDEDWRIMGGSDAEKGSYPWMVQILHMQSNSFSHACGGALIYPNWVITAAHCVSNQLNYMQDLRIVLGAHHTGETDDGMQTFTVSHVIQHECSDCFVDIALIRLAEVAAYTDTVYPVCLPKHNQTTNLAMNDCYVVGWGLVDTKTEKMAEVLQQVRAQIVEESICANTTALHYDSRHLCVAHYSPKSYSSSDGSSGTCSGDSGGPMTCWVDSRWRLLGVYSRGGDVCSSAGVFVKISSDIRKWIRETVRSVEITEASLSPNAVKWCSQRVAQGCTILNRDDVYGKLFE